MQNRQGYCSYCRVHYNNLEQHMFSTQHRNLATLSRHQMGTSSLMERFLQDVLRHHPYQYQENRSAHNERLLMNTVSPSEVAHFDDFISEEIEDTAGFTGEIPTKSLEPVEELCSRPGKSQEYIQNVSIRPSVIQKLEKGQQQPLKFVHKIGSSMKEFNLIDIGQTSNNGQNLVSCSVISSAPTSCLSESCYDRPVKYNITRLPLAAHSDSVGKCDPKKVNRYLDQVGKVFSNPVSSPHLESFSISYQKPKESNRKSLGVNSGKLVLQKGVKSQDKTLSTDFKFHETVGTEGSFRFESDLSNLPVNSAGILSETGMPSNKGIFEDDIPKYHEEVFSTTDCTQEEKHLIFNKSTFLEQKSSMSSEMKFGCGSLQSLSGQSQETVQELNLWKEEQVDQKDKNYESRGSEMSFDCSSSFHSLTDQSKVTAKEINFSKEVYDDLQCKNNKSCVSEISSDCDSSLQLVTNQSQMTAKEISLQKAIHDQSYEYSSSEINFDCDAPIQSIIDHPQQPIKEVNLPKEVHTGLIDKNYESSSSKISADSAFPFQTMVDLFPMVVKDIKLWKKSYISLVDKNYGSSCSETSFDCISLQSVVDHPELTAKERNLKDRHVDLKDKKCKPSGAKVRLDCDVCLQTVTDDPQRTVEEINLLKENADLVNKSCESHGLEMHFHTVAHVVADQSQVAVKDVNLQEVNIDLENKSDESSISDISFDSHTSLHHSTNDQPQGAQGERNLKEFSVDMEVKSYACSSSELTFDSDPPLLSVTEHSQLAFNEIREEHINLENKSCEYDSSDITFDSDIPLQPVVDQPQVTVYEEEHIDLENKSNESCISEITFDSDTPFHSGTDQSDQLTILAVKEITIQKEEHVHLENKRDESSGSEISLNSDIPLHSVTNPSEVVVKQTLQKEEKEHLENRGSEPSSPDFIMDYDSTFHSMTGHSKVPIKEIKLQKGQVHSENKDNGPNVSEINLKSDIPLHLVNEPSDKSIKEIKLHKEDHINVDNKGKGPSVSEISLKTDIPLHLVTDHHDIAVKIINLQKEEIYLENKGNKFGISEATLHSDIPLLSVMHQFEVVGKEIHLQKEKHADLKDKSAELSGSEIILDSYVPHYSVTKPQITDKKTNIQKEEYVVLENKNDECSRPKIILDSDVSHYSVTEPHITDKEINIQKEEHVLENKSDECSGPKIILDSDVPFQSMTEKPQVALLREDGFYPEDEDTEVSGFEISLDIALPLHSVTDQSQLALLKEKHIDLYDKISQSCGSKISFHSDDPLQSLAEQLQEAVTKINLWKEEDIGLENKTNESNVSKLIPGSDFSLHSAVDQPEVVVKQIHLEKEAHVYLEDKNSQYSGSEMSLDSDFLVQSIVDQPLITILEQEHIELEDKHTQSCGSEITFDSDDDPLQSVADQLKETVKKISLWKDEEVGLEDKRDDSRGCEIMYNSDVLHSVSGQTEGVVKEISLQKEHVNLEDKIDESSLKLNFDSNEPLQSVADEIQEAIKEISFLREKHICLNDKDFEPNGSEIIYVSNVPLQSVAEQPQILKGRYANLEDKKDSESLSFSKVRHHRNSDTDRWVGNIQHKYKRNTFKYYDPLNNQIVINPPQNTVVPESDRHNWVKIHFNRSNLNSSAQDDVHIQSSASASLMTVPVRYGLRSCQGASGSSVFLEKSEVLNSSEIPKESSFRLTPLSHDVSKISPKSVGNESLESKSKKKMQRRKMTISNKPNFPQKVYRPIILQQKDRIASEKQSIWIRTKPSDIIRKYIPKYSVFLRHKYQSRSAFIGIHLKKKKTDVSSLKKMKRLAKMPLNASISPAGTDEQLRKIASSAPKPPVQDPSSIAGRKMNGNKNRLSTPKQPSKPVKIYELRSLSSRIAQSDRMRTRLSDKLRGHYISGHNLQSRMGESVNYNVNYNPCLVAVLQNVFINCNECTTLMKDVANVEKCGWCGERAYENPLYILCNIYVIKVT